MDNRICIFLKLINFSNIDYNLKKNCCKIVLNSYLQNNIKSYERNLTEDDLIKIENDIKNLLEGIYLKLIRLLLILGAGVFLFFKYNIFMTKFFSLIISSLCFRSFFVWIIKYIDLSKKIEHYIDVF